MIIGNYRVKDLASLFLAVALILCGDAPLSANGQAGIDNSALIPKWLPDREVRMEGMSPDWVKTLIMAEVRIETATPEGTFVAAVKVLDHYREMGVNGLWINPIAQQSSERNGYVNFGPHTIEPRMTGANTLEESYAAVRHFVAEAHKRNIRIFFDILVWGTAVNAPLVTEHPEFYIKKNGRYAEEWGGYAFDWESVALRAWYKDMAVALIEKTDADGFRVDLAPNKSGYFFKEIRDALYAKGHKIVLIAEVLCERKDTFDFEEIGVVVWNPHDTRWLDGHGDYLFKNNIVDVIKTGTGIGMAPQGRKRAGGQDRFYVSNLLCHDDYDPFVRGNRIRFAYGSLFAPFIPMWWIGEEWNNPKQLDCPLTHPSYRIMYFNTINWAARENGANKAFFEDVKRYIRIRRSYPEIFEQFTRSNREANIVKVESLRGWVPNTMQAYGRFGSGKAVLVVPNDAGSAAEFHVLADITALGLNSSQRFKITDLLTGAVVFRGSGRILEFTGSIPAQSLGVYLVEPA